MSSVEKKPLIIKSDELYLISLAGRITLCSARKNHVLEDNELLSPILFSTIEEIGYVDLLEAVNFAHKEWNLGFCSEVASFDDTQVYSLHSRYRSTPDAVL